MLCDIENKILQCMINHLNKKDLVKSSLVMIFDGFMIPKENLNNVDIDDLLRDLEKVVHEELKYKINLDVKPMKDIIEVPKDYKPKNELKNKFVDDYDAFADGTDVDDGVVLGILNCSDLRARAVCTIMRLESSSVKLCRSQGHGHLPKNVIGS